MSRKMDDRIVKTGTKFRIFSQPHYLPGFDEPETVWISAPAGTIAPGPADERMVVVDAVEKKPYGSPYLPPYEGDTHPPVTPNAEGHFDHLPVASREFKVAQSYATVRRVLDIWEDYFGQPIEWHFRNDYKRMELIPLIQWGNAHMGYGFLESGFAENAWGRLNPDRPYCLNFDVLAHEVGHAIIHSQIDVPVLGARTEHFAAFHESAGDVIAIVASLHCDRVVDHLLNHSFGNLFSDHVLGRIGELSRCRQIRQAFNHETMSTVTADPHDLAQPLTGALFDILTEVFQDELVRANLICGDLANISYHKPGDAIDEATIEAGFREAYAGQADGFKSALLTARDYLGALLASAWNELSADRLTFGSVGTLLLAADQDLSGGRYQQTIGAAFAWREISILKDG